MDQAKKLQNQLKEGLEAAKKVEVIDPSKNSRIIFCGMGGSIMPAEAVSMLWLRRSGRSSDPAASELDTLNIYINRTPYLPHWSAPDSFVICTSWSGNTEETIACYKQAQQKNMQLAVITSGGKLAVMAQEDKIPLILLPNPENIQPRNAFGKMLSATLTLISRSAIIQNTIESSSFENLGDSKTALAISSEIGDKTPLIYSSYPWRFLGSFWKKFLNENCKIHAFSNFLPEAGHNEIAPIFINKNRGSSIRKNESGPVNGCDYFYLLLKDREEEKEDIEKLEKLEKFLKIKKIDHCPLEISGSNRLEKILSQYLAASQTSVALAKNLGVNPDSMETIESFKKL